MDGTELTRGSEGGMCTRRGGRESSGEFVLVHMWPLIQTLLNNVERCLCILCSDRIETTGFFVEEKRYHPEHRQVKFV